ncbi:M23 family metallopeptidase [Pseudonocardia sp.]|uniref:M23 family metallopeptidase n=1 Tax=Pseudonocardia sp. TaxID=60912 RepID=UPI003D101BEF
MPARHRLARSLVALLAAPLVVAACSGAPAVSPSAPPSAPPSVPAGGIDPSTAFTPVSATTLTTPAPVTGTDGRTHLAYELLLTNASPAPLRLDKIDVLDAGNRSVLLSMSGATLAASSNLISGDAGDEGTAEPTASGTPIPASATAMVWLDVAVDGAPPAALTHHVDATMTTPAGDRASESTVGRIDVSTATAPVLGPVMAGGPWYASDGCCVDDTHHRRGLAPINGTLLVPQRFAIDWYLLDDQHRAWVGDPSKLTSYYAYDKPALAAADGVVVDATDGFAETTSAPNPPPLPPIKETVGNHVTVMIAPGVHLLYAHFKTGTVAVKTGQPVKRGDVLGHIGSSGNSTAPHLHFQVMTEPTFFPTDSTPFAFECFTVDGQVTERIWDDVLGLQPDPVLPYTASADSSRRQGQMPLDRNVITFC